MKNVIIKLLKKIKHIIYKIIGYSVIFFNRHEKLEINNSSEKLEDYWSNKCSCYNDKQLPEEKSDVYLSIIVPLYNSSKVMDKCISSLIFQETNYKYEIILINDGSKDNTYEKAEKYQKENPEKIVLTSQSNSGISSARNRGIQLSTGRYIGFVDHDDYLDSTFVQKMIETAENERADIVKCAYSIVNKKGYIENYQEKQEIVEGKMKYELFDYKGYIWGGIYKRKIFEHVCFPVSFWYEDMITRLLVYRQSNKFINIDEVLYTKLIHENNASSVVWSNKNYKCLEHIYLLEEIVCTSSKLKLENDIFFYQCLVRELSEILVTRVEGLPENIKKIVLVRASDLLNRFYKNEYESAMLKKYKIRSQIIRNKNLKSWLLLPMIAN